MFPDASSLNDSAFSPFPFSLFPLPLPSPPFSQQIAGALQDHVDEQYPRRSAEEKRGGGPKEWPARPPSSPRGRIGAFQTAFVLYLTLRPTLLRVLLCFQHSSGAGADGVGLSLAVGMEGERGRGGDTSMTQTANSHALLSSCVPRYTSLKEKKESEEKRRVRAAKHRRCVRKAGAQALNPRMTEAVDCFPLSHKRFRWVCGACGFLNAVYVYVCMRLSLSCL